MIVRALWGLALGLVAAFGLIFTLGAGFGPVQSLAALLMALLACYGAARTAGEPPPEIRLASRWTIPVTVASIVFLFGALLMMDSFYEAIHGAPAPGLTIEGWAGLLRFLAAYALLILIHELVHYAAFRYYGARPRFLLLVKPFPGAAVYAERHPLRRRAMLVVALAPAVVLTVAFAALLAVPKLAVVAIWGAALNLAGAVVDFAMAAWLLCLPPGTWVEDLRDGIRVLPTGEAVRHLRYEDGRWEEITPETRTANTGGPSAGVRVMRGRL
ncbi:MAG TPA: DUF3267 domain-containing protein, partial [Thermaerobacter sp.]